MFSSFKITKKPSSTSAPVVAEKSSAVPSSSKKAFYDDDDRDDEEPDFIDGLDGDNIVSKKKQKKTEKKELVIPLITKNEWRIDKKTEEQIVSNGNDNVEDEDIPNSENKPKDSLQEQAIKELLNEASSNNTSDKKNSKTIPILFQNRVPDGFEEDDNMDVSLRPEQSTLDDYERIPVEDFGLAVLRGMGWKETEGIGLKNKKVVDMTEPKLRPKGMGLGAEAAHLKKDVAPKNASSGNEEKEDLSFKIGAYAVITRGSKKGYYGKIESFDEDNNRVILKLGISGKMEAVSKFYINIVPEKEYKKNSKVINSEKYEEYKAKQDKKDKRRREGNLETYDDDDDEMPEEPRKKKINRSDSNSDDSDEHRSRSKSKRKERDDYEYEQRSDKRSGHKYRDGGKSHHRSDETARDRRDDYDRHSSSKHDRKYDGRDNSRNGDSFRNLSRNGDKKNDRDHYGSRRDDRDRRYRE